jgi:hypothetical protein
MWNFQRSYALPLALSAMFLIPVSCAAKHQKPPSIPTFSREEMMMLNLDRGGNSAGSRISASLKAVKSTQHDLERAQHQIEQADAALSKAHNRPDDRTMLDTIERLKLAQKTAQQLADQLEQARDELKADLKQALVK